MYGLDFERSSIAQRRSRSDEAAATKPQSWVYE